MVAICVELRAQHVCVIPAEAARLEGNAADHGPFGRDHQRHVQYIDQSLVPLPKGTVLHAIAYRRDGIAAPKVMVRAKPGEPAPKPVWVTRLGNPSVSVGSPPATYPAITDPNWQVVVNPRAFTFPDLPLVSVPAPFDLVFPFDQPFVHAGGNLGIEHLINHRMSVSYDYAVDAVVATTEAGWTEATPSPAGAPRIAGALGGPGGSFVVNLFDAPAHSYVALELSHGQVLLGLPTVTNGDGFAQVQHRLPASALWNDAVLQARFMAPQPLTGMLTMHCGRLHMPSALRMSVVAGFGASHVERGFVQPGRGPVLQLRW